MSSGAAIVEQSLSPRDKIIACLKVVRFVGAVAMLCAVVAGVLGYPEARFWVAGAGGLTGAGVAALVLKATHNLS